MSRGSMNWLGIAIGMSIHTVLDGVALVPSLIQADGLHPNAEGVARIVARLLPLVIRLLGEARPA